MTESISIFPLLISVNFSDAVSPRVFFNSFLAAGASSCKVCKAGSNKDSAGACVDGTSAYRMLVRVFKVVLVANKNG